MRTMCAVLGLAACASVTLPAGAAETCSADAAALTPMSVSMSASTSAAPPAASVLVSFATECAGAGGCQTTAKFAPLDTVVARFPLPPGHARICETVATVAAAGDAEEGCATTYAVRTRTVRLDGVEGVKAAVLAFRLVESREPGKMVCYDPDTTEAATLANFIEAYDNGHGATVFVSETDTYANFEEVLAAKRRFITQQP